MASHLGVEKGSLFSLCIIFFLTISVYLFILFNIPFARPILGFIYFSFIPGFLLLRIIGLNPIDYLEKILYSVGLSVAFLMVFGLAINFVGPYIGVSEPLSLEFLSLTISIFIMFLAAIDYWKHRNTIFVETNESSCSFSRFLILLLFPILGVVGSVLVNISGNNWVLLVTILAIVGLFIFGMTSGKLIPNKFLSICLLMISIALLFSLTLISNYIQGSDIQLEYYLFRLTQSHSYWDPSFFFGDFARALDTARYNSMLSITILPTEYSNLLGLDATWTMKLIFPLIYSFVPICLYYMIKTQMGEKIAFVSAFLLMAEQNFLLNLSMAREMVGELFFLLLFLVLFSKKISSSIRMPLFLIFSFALVVSHYSMAILFLFFLLFIFFFQIIKKETVSPINITIISLFYVIMFSWFIISSNAASFDSFVMFITNTIRDLNQFFVPSSRGDGVLSGIGLQNTGISPLQTISRIFAYSVQLFIVIGVFAVILGRTGRNVSSQFKYLIIGSAFLLVLTILLPGFALSLEVSRFYHISLFFLAPVFVLGCEIIARLFFKRNVRKRAFAVTFIVLIITVPYFLFQTNFLYEVTEHESWSVPLSIYRMGVRPYTAEFSFAQESDVFAAKWLNSNSNTSSNKIYADFPSIFIVLTSYGMVPRDVGGNIIELSNVTILTPNSIIFLSKINLENRLFGSENNFFNQSEIQPVLNFTNSIYTNGRSQILYAPVSMQPVN
jgi:uncharacterized membrane protein